jgi:large subunit ribosomal protein L30e
MTTNEELKKIAESSKVIFGSTETIKRLKQAKVSKVFIASNIPADIEKDIKYNAELSGADVEKINVPNDEFGIIFKRTHTLLAISVLKD